MIDVGLCPADVLLQLTDLRRQLVASQLESLGQLGYERDIELLFHGITIRTANPHAKKDGRLMLLSPRFYGLTEV